MPKYEWRKQEKTFYFPKNQPMILDVPAFKFITISGAGSPQAPGFQDYITALYSMAYAIKMNLKKEANPPEGYMDYTVYPLEGWWDISEAAKEKAGYDYKNYVLDKNDFVFKLMIRQPDFVSDEFFHRMQTFTQKKKPQKLLEEVKLETITDGKCVQMMHIGSYDDEPASFEIMETFTTEQNLIRLAKDHREIYLSDFRKVAPEKLKTVLRFKVK